MHLVPAQTTHKYKSVQLPELAALTTLCSKNIWLLHMQNPALLCSTVLGPKNRGVLYSHASYL